MKEIDYCIYFLFCKERLVRGEVEYLVEKNNRLFQVQVTV